MHNQVDHHKMVVGSFIKNKLEEYRYFLEKLINICLLVENNFQNGINPVNTSNENINYTFNSLTNTFQSLKDSLETATGKKIAWSELYEIEHGRFIKESRNAITHDGMQIINAYTDGKYYIANDIERLDAKGNFIKIEAPQTDILKLSLEFTIGFMNKIQSLIIDYGESIPKSSHPVKMQDIEKYLTNPVVPKFVRELIKENKDEIEKQLSSVRFDPVQDIMNESSKITDLCNVHIDIMTPADR
ncbi:hypothetical protein GCM10023116_05030 [Kistimonas scapharcae]|uniref:Cthe-2314-like HEPN domain-containing protein n=1 Tax=Kistimonas scapharcae TaxID=1036133 RepID=A0ABP8UWF1_9GAMM